MTPQQLLEKYPETKNNPLKYVVEHLMRVKGWGLSSEKEFMKKSILLQDFYEEASYYLEEINGK